MSKADVCRAVFRLVSQSPESLRVKTIARALQLDPLKVIGVVEELEQAQLVFIILAEGRAPRLTPNSATLRQWAALYEEADRAFA
jgi:Mn-dependent DtxR family transcriptional regulator